MSEKRVFTFASIHGHDGVRDFLQGAVAKDRLPHAMLFAGAEGIGKHAFALALTAWLQCAQRGRDSCGECAPCRQVNARTHADVRMIGIPDKKKEIGVESAREVKRFVQLKPAGGGVKVALIDEAHSLNQAAQNALLKTLEDPPLRSILILVANNPDALLPTVRSRCRRINFQPLGTELVKKILMENHGIDAKTATRLAAVSEGSPGRALELRRHLQEDAGSLSDLVGSLQGASYVSLMQAAAGFATPEEALPAKLEILLAQLRDAAAARGDQPLEAAKVLRQAGVVAETAEILRRSAPNRQLLLDQLMLRLARC